MSKVFEALMNGTVKEVKSLVKGKVENVIIHKNRYYTFHPIMGRTLPVKKADVQFLDVMTTAKELH